MNQNVKIESWSAKSRDLKDLVGSRSHYMLSILMNGLHCELLPGYPRL